MTRLSDSQLVVLTAACQRPDGCVFPITAKLKGNAAGNVLKSLLTKGQLKEVRAERDDTVWRRDDEDRPLTLYATPAAYQALGIEQETSGQEAEAFEKPKRTRVAKGAKVTKEKLTRTRADSKQAQLIEMLKSPKGARIDEIAAAFDWQPHYADPRIMPM